MYQVIRENLSGLGSPMGTEDTSDSNIGHFRKITNAKGACEKDYGKDISWRRTNSGWRSPDLGHVMYHIRLIELKD